jgi:hypothetical protein
MSIAPGHHAELERILTLPAFELGPTLTFGVVPLIGGGESTAADPRAFQHPDLGSILRSRGASRVETLDLFDPDADWRVDMNEPIPDELRSRFATVIDLGSLEHVFDTRQCLENEFRMLRTGGHLVLQTPCKGCYDHGFHTFSPECILMALADNGFTVRHIALTTLQGRRLADPSEAEDVVLWTVGRKERDQPFVAPQQKRSRFMYGLSSRPITK